MRSNNRRSRFLPRRRRSRRDEEFLTGAVLNPGRDGKARDTLVAGFISNFSLRQKFSKLPMHILTFPASLSLSSQSLSFSPFFLSLNIPGFMHTAEHLFTFSRLSFSLFSVSLLFFSLFSISLPLFVSLSLSFSAVRGINFKNNLIIKRFFVDRNLLLFKNLSRLLDPWLTS